MGNSGKGLLTGDKGEGEKAIREFTHRSLEADRQRAEIRRRSLKTDWEEESGKLTMGSIERLKKRREDRKRAGALDVRRPENSDLTDMSLKTDRMEGGGELTWGSIE